MTTIRSRRLEDSWKKRLDLTDRDAPELYENVETVRNSPHAGAIRATLEGLGASAVFCVQGVPTIVIANLEQYDRDQIVGLHAALWNQGLASLLLVITDDTVRAFSLSRTPYSDPGAEFERRCLVKTLSATADALALKNMIYGAESGRFWEEHAEFFKPKERVDQVLLENLTSAHGLLCEAGLLPDAAQALLIQAMFIAYLEDREIIGKEYLRDAAGDSVVSFSELLRSGSVSALKKLFYALRQDFHGDLFVAPCSFEPNLRPPRVSREHLTVLERFRLGQEEMAAGQLRFWGYNFKHIPIELISAVYDRFLGERESGRRYRYYVSGNFREIKDHPKGVIARLPAVEIENAVLNGIREALLSRRVLAEALGMVPAADCRELAHILNNHTAISPGDLVCRVVDRIIIDQQKITIRIMPSNLRSFLQAELDISLPQNPLDDSYSIEVPFQVQKSYRGAVVIRPDQETRDRIFDRHPQELKNLVRGIIWRDEHFQGLSIREIARREGLNETYVGRLVRESFSTLQS